MEENLANLRLRWDVLRGFAGTMTIATFVLILSTIPTSIWALWLLALIVGVLTSVIALVKCDFAWNMLTTLEQGILLGIALFSGVLKGAPGENLPILLLAFVMILVSEHTLSLISEHGDQFSPSNHGLEMDFNVPVLRRSLDRLYRRLARDGCILGMGFVLSIAVASTSGILVPIAPLLSDISVYVLVTSVALAVLIVSKEE